MQQAVVELAAQKRLADISLADIADRSHVSVRTLLRYYGTRAELLSVVAEELEAATFAERPQSPDDVDGALSGLADEYEALGHLLLRLLAQEDDDPLARSVTDRGRASHRRWVQQLFELDPVGDVEQLDLLVVATDLSTWKLLRHDRGLRHDEALDRMRALVTAVRRRDTIAATTATEHASRERR